MHKWLVSSIVAALLAAGPAALADDPVQQPGGSMMMMGPMWSAPMGPDMMMGPGGGPAYGMMSMMGWGGMAVGTVDGHLAFLRTELAITPAQEPLWNDFAATIRGNAEQMRTTHHWEHIYGAGTLPERLSRYEEHLSARLDMLHKAQAAVTPLYAALDDGQKARADQILFGHMEHM